MGAMSKNNLRRITLVRGPTMSDTFQEMTFFDTGAFDLFYLHLTLILWYPQPPNSMLGRRCCLCSRRNRKIDIVLGGMGKIVTKTPKNRIHTTKYVSTLLSPIVCNRKLAFAEITGVIFYWNVYHRFVPRFGSFSCQNYGKLTLQYRNLRKISPCLKCNFAWHSCVTSPS